MPRPSRASRPRRGAPAAKVSAPPSDPPSAPASIAKVTIIPSDDEEEDDIYGVSDRGEEHDARAPNAHVTSARSTRSRARLASSSSAGAVTTARKGRDGAKSRLDDLTTTSYANDDTAVPEFGRNALGLESSLLGGRVPAMESSLLGGAGNNLSGMEINDSEIFGHLDSSFENGGKETTGSNSGTRSADTSTFNVSVFRRQPAGGRRQSSIVSKDDAPIRPSSRGPTTPGLGSTLNLGNFRRRKRQPSILMSSAQKANLGLQRSRATSVETENAVEADSDMEESFLPEAEGTPVRLSRGRKSAADEDEAEQTEETAHEAEGERETRSKKRKSTESHESENAKRQAIEAETEAKETVHRSVEIEAPSSPLSVHDSEPSSPPSFIMRSIARRQATQELNSDILAPPEDSDSREGSVTMWPSLKDLGKKRSGTRARKATPDMDDDAMSDLSDPPSLTHSPNFKATKPAPKTKPKASPKLSTADLEALLPRRRRKSRQDPYDQDNQEGTESEQEAPRRPVVKKNPARPLKGSSKTNQTNAAKPVAAPAKRTTRRTYGSRRFDKENTVEGESIEVSEPLDDTAFEADVNEDTTTTLGRLPAELKAASKKFKEVDKWELDFEEVAEPSSDLPDGR